MHGQDVQIKKGYWNSGKLKKLLRDLLVKNLLLYCVVSSPTKIYFPVKNMHFFLSVENKRD